MTAGKGPVWRGPATARPSSERAVWLSTHVLPHEGELRAWLSGRVRRFADVDDIVQEAYAALAMLEDVSGIRQPKAYFFVTARAVLLQRMRRARIVPIETIAEMDTLAVLQDELSPERHLDGRQELYRLKKLVDGLPPKCREAFLLRKVEELSQKEIAARMGISENTVEKHVVKALRLLMDGMQRVGVDAEVPKGASSGTVAKGMENAKEEH